MDTGCCNKTGINLQEVDVSVKSDQQFLYDIVLFRWRHKDIINMPHRSPTAPPTFTEHVVYLQKNIYKKIYRINLHKDTIGTIYLDNNSVFSVFILPQWLKAALKKHKQVNRDSKRISVIIFELLMKLHKDIKTFYFGVNAKNSACLNAAKEIKAVPLEITFSCDNIYTNGG